MMEFVQIENNKLLSDYSVMEIFTQREGRERERERNIDCLSLACPHLGNWPATQARTSTRNQTGIILVHRLALNALSHTSQGSFYT